MQSSVIGVAVFAMGQIGDVALWYLAVIYNVLLFHRTETLLRIDGLVAGPGRCLSA